MTGSERVGASAKDKNVFGVFFDDRFDFFIILKGKLSA